MVGPSPNRLNAICVPSADVAISVLVGVSVLVSIRRSPRPGSWVPPDSTPSALGLASRPMTSRRAAVLAWTLAGWILVVVATTTLLAFLNRASIRNIDEANLIEIVLPIGFALVGGLVASRLPTNPLGWVFLAISLANAIPGTALQYTLYALVTAPGA